MKIFDREKRSPKTFFYAVTFSFSFAAFMVRMDSYIVNICLPTMARYFQVDTGAISLVVLAYMLVLTSTMLAMGSLGDRFGLKRLFLTGYAIFTVGSFFCGFSSSLTGLVISRGLQGLGGAMLITAGFAIIPRFLPKEMTGWAFGIIATTTSLGILLGAPLGSYIAAFLSWQWIFYINVPIGVAAVWFSWRILPDDTPAATEEPPAFDTIGAVLSVIALTAFTMTVVAKGKGSWLIPAGSFLAFAAFILHEKRHASPLVDLTLFRNQIFAWANLVTFLVMSVLAGINFLFPFYLEGFQGLAVSISGLVMMFLSAVLIPASLVSGKLADRLNPALLCSFSVLVAIIASALFMFTMGNPGLSFSLIVLGMFGLSIGLFGPSNNRLVMGSVQVEQQGTASGVFNTILNLGLLVGVGSGELIFSQTGHMDVAIPVGMAGQAKSLLEGYRAVFGTAVGIFLLAFACSIVTIRITTKKGTNHVNRSRSKRRF